MNLDILINQAHYLIEKSYSLGCSDCVIYYKLCDEEIKNINIYNDDISLIKSQKNLIYIRVNKNGFCGQITSNFNSIKNQVDALKSAVHIADLGIIKKFNITSSFRINSNFDTSLKTLKNLKLTPNFYNIFDNKSYHNFKIYPTITNNLTKNLIIINKSIVDWYEVSNIKTNLKFEYINNKNLLTDSVSFMDSSKKSISQNIKGNYKKLKTLSNVLTKEPEFDYIVLAPRVVSKLFIIPLNQILNSKNNSVQINKPSVFISKNITLIDSPNDINSPFFKKFDLQGINTQSRTFIKSGDIIKLFGKPDHKSNIEIVDGFLTEINGRFINSLHYPSISCCGKNLYDEIRNSKVLIINDFIGRVNSVNNIINGIFTNIIYSEYSNLVGKYKDIIIKISYEKLMKNTIKAINQSQDINFIIPSNCPYISISKEVLNE
jgi:PmbA/TldA metallopeptidase C-terminal domain